MNITTHKVKQYNATSKTVICVNGEPICMAVGGKTVSNIIAYLNGYNVDIADGKIKKALDKCKAENKDTTKFKVGKIKERMEFGACNAISGESLCFSCKTKGCMFQSGIVRTNCDFYKSGSENV